MARSIPAAAIGRLGELVPSSWSFAQMGPILDWADAPIERAVESALAEQAEDFVRTPALTPGERASEDTHSRLAVGRVAAEPPTTASASLRKGTSGTGALWSNAEIATLTEMAGQGATAAEIAAALNRPHSAVASRLTAMRKKGELVPGKPRLGDLWTEAQDAELLRRVRAGESGRQIAAALGRTLRAVTERAGRLRARGVDVPPRVKGAPARRKAPAKAVRAVKPKAATAEVVATAAKAKPAPKVVVREPAPRETEAPFPRADDTQDDDDDDDDACVAIPACIHRIAADITKPVRPEVLRAMAHLDRVPPHPRLTPGDDMRLLVETIHGVPSVVLADELGMTPKELGSRFKMMVPAGLRDPRGHLSLDGGKVLLEAVKRNAMEG